MVGDLYRDALPHEGDYDSDECRRSWTAGRMMSLALDDAAWAFGRTQIIPLTGSVRR